MKVPSPDFLALLRTLVEHRVEFIIVGGVAAVLQGAPISTFDLDVVHARTEDNLERLLAALEELEACYRGQGDRQLVPGSSHLETSGHQLLMTRFGPLDLLGTIGAGHGYEELARHAVGFEVSGMHLRVLDLETLIKVKEETGHEKDKAILPILRATLKERSKR